MSTERKAARARRVLVLGSLVPSSIAGCNLILDNEVGRLVGDAGSGGVAVDAGSGGSSGELQGGSGAGGSNDAGAPPGAAGEGGNAGRSSGGSSGCGAGGADSSAECVPEPCERCALPHAETMCVAGECAVARCVGPWRDVNQEAPDGCESGDVPTAGLSLWFLGDRGLMAPAGSVSSWQDVSGNGSTATQPDVARQPRAVSAAGRPLMLEFDGVDDHLVLPQGFSTFSGASFFAVVEAVETARCTSLLSFATGPGVNDVEFGRHVVNLLHYEVFNVALDGAANAFGAGRRSVVDIVQGADRRVELRINRTITGSGSVPLPAVVVRTQNFIGRNLYDACEPGFRGRIGEIVFYTRGVSPPERDRIAGYLSEKWAILP